MPRFIVKVDYVAALRNAGGGSGPDPSKAAVLAELAGADGICCHLREDRKFIRDRDIYIIRELIKPWFYLQIAPTDDLIERALEVKPKMVTLMPYSSDDNIIKEGANLKDDFDKYADAADSIAGADIEIACFIEPDNENVKNVARAKIGIVEFNCRAYTEARAEEIKDERERLDQAVQFASKLGMSIGCGGGLNYDNIRPLIEIEEINYFNIGHAVISKAQLVGMDRAVRDMAVVFCR